jgi:hypothetical protein
VFSLRHGDTRLRGASAVAGSAVAIRERSCRGDLPARECVRGPQPHKIVGPAPAREDTRLYTIAPAREDMLRAVDMDDLALIRPIFRAVHQARANWIFADVFPFLCVTFIIAQ